MFAVYWMPHFTPGDHPSGDRAGCFGGQWLQQADSSGGVCKQRTCTHEAYLLRFCALCACFYGADGTKWHAEREAEDGAGCGARRRSTLGGNAMQRFGTHAGVVSDADPSGIYVEGMAAYVGAEAEDEDEGARRRDYRLKSRGEQYGTT